MDTVLEVGKPGATTSAKIDVLETGKLTDVGKVIQEELDELNPVQEGYKEDMVKYEKQIRRYNDQSR
jgi:phage tail sheath protein FI